MAMVEVARQKEIQAASVQEAPPPPVWEQLLPLFAGMLAMGLLGAVMGTISRGMQG